MTEIAAGGGAVLVDPTSIDEIAGAMERIVVDGDFYADLLEQLRQRSMRTWDNYGQNIRTALKQASRAAPLEKIAHIDLTPNQQQQQRLNIESALFEIDDIDLGRDLEKNGSVTKICGAIEYRPLAEVYEQTEKQLIWVGGRLLSGQPICYCPCYVSGPGNLEFQIEGEIKGKCRVLVTSDNSREIHFDAEMDSFVDSISISIPDRLKEIVLLVSTTQSLSHLRVEGISLTRSFAGDEVYDRT